MNDEEVNKFVNLIKEVKDNSIMMEHLGKLIYEVQKDGIDKGYAKAKADARKEFEDKINNLVKRIDNNELNEGGIHNEHEYCIDKDSLFKELKSLSDTKENPKND
jgi:hypothetical protein